MSFMVTCCACWCLVQSLDRFLRTHGTGVPFLLGIQYSFAEVMTASFLWRAQVTLLAYRNINMLDRAKSDGNSRFISWAQVRVFT